MTISQKLFRAKLCRLGFAVLAAGFWAVGCANNNSESTAATSATTEIVLAYTHSADYSSYKLDWVEKTGASFSAKTNQLTLSSSGLRSPTIVGNYLLIVDSSSTGRLLAYNRSDMTIAGQTNVGSYPQDMVVVNNTAYIANGATGTNLLKRVDLSNLPAMSALSDITVGNQPSVVRYYNNRIYVGNQDWNSKTQATVSVVNPVTNTVETTFNTGPNNMDIAFDGTRIWTYNADWYNNSFVCQQNASLTYAPVSGYSPSNMNPPSGYDVSSNCAKSGLAFNSNGGFVALRHTSGQYHLFSISGTTINTTPVDSTNRYVFVGNGASHLYKIHNGDGSTSTLTTRIEDLSGNVLATVNLTKDTDMYFHVLK
ncbi:MAG: YncE family protein [Spirochaetota bacterium]